MMDLIGILQSWDVNLVILEMHFKCILLHAKNGTPVTEEPDFRGGRIQNLCLEKLHLIFPSNFSSPSTKKKQSDPHGFVEVVDVNDGI